MSEHKQHCGGCGKVLTIRCEPEHQVITATEPGTVEREKSLEERVVEIIVADLKANGKIRMALLEL